MIRITDNYCVLSFFLQGATPRISAPQDMDSVLVPGVFQLARRRFIGLPRQ